MKQNGTMPNPHRIHVLPAILVLLLVQSLIPGQDTQGGASIGWRSERVEKGLVNLRKHKGSRAGVGLDLATRCNT